MSSLSDQNPELIARLRRLVGSEFEHLGRRYLLVEVLVDEAVLILRRHPSAPIIQTDQYGHPCRFVHETLEIPILAADNQSLSEPFQELLQLGS